jgi:hypothetical protein
MSHHREKAIDDGPVILPFAPRDVSANEYGSHGRRSEKVDDDEPTILPLKERSELREPPQPAA